jgi:hypothetical protein
MFSDTTAVLHNSLSFWLALILQTSCSITGPRTFLKLFLPHILSFFSAKDHVSQLTVKKLSTTPWRCMEEWMYRSHFLDLGTSWRWVVSFTPWTLYPRYPLLRRLVDPRAGLDEVEKRKFLTLKELELRPLGRPARSQSLYRLRYPGSSTDCCVKLIAFQWKFKKALLSLYSC